MTLICEKCKQESESGKFCQECGSSLKEKTESLKCPKCGFKPEKPMKFCPECRAEFSPDPGKGGKDSPKISRATEAAESTDSEVEKSIKSLQNLYPKLQSIVEKKWGDMKILVVDDHSTIRKIVANILLDMNVKQSHIVEAINGKDAVDQLMSGKYDFIISDWYMPRLTGLDLLKIVKSVPGLLHIPFLMLTAEAQKDRIIQAIKGGVDNYIIKPFTGKSLEEKLNSTFFNAIRKNTE